MFRNLKDKFYNALNPLRDTLSNLTQNVIPQKATQIASNPYLNKLGAEIEQGRQQLLSTPLR